MTLLDRIASFADFRAAYPKRRGGTAWTIAEKAWQRAIKLAEPRTIVMGAVAYAKEMRELGRWGTEYVCMPATWLNQERWRDYEAPTAAKPMSWVSVEDTRWADLSDRYHQEFGRLPPRTAGLNGQGWRFPSEWLQKKGTGDFAQPTGPTSALDGARTTYNPSVMVAQGHSSDG